MDVFFNVLLVILVIAVVVLAVLYFLGRKMEKRQVEQQSMMEAAKQVVSILVIDKKKLKAKDSGLPKMVTDQVPWYMKRAKFPIVKAKIGPKVTTLIADERVVVLADSTGRFCHADAIAGICGCAHVDERYAEEAIVHHFLIGAKAAGG